MVIEGRNHDLARASRIVGSSNRQLDTMVPAEFNSSGGTHVESVDDRCHGHVNGLGSESCTAGQWMFRRAVAVSESTGNTNRHEHRNELSATALSEP